jgi:hypothetical protein
VLIALPAVVAGLVGCNANLAKRELVVHFSQEATADQHRSALEACTGAAPNTSPEPIVHDSRYPSTSISDVRFRIDHADDRDIAQLETCLMHQPGVLGAEDTAGLTS